MTIVTESIVEDAALDWFRKLGYTVLAGSEGAGPGGLRDDYTGVVLESPLRGALERLNPGCPEDALRDAERKLRHPDGATLEARNRSFHRMVVDGVNVEYRNSEGTLRGAYVRIIHFYKPEANICARSMDGAIFGLRIGNGAPR